MSDKIQVSNKLFALLTVFLVGIIAFFAFRAVEIWHNIEGNFPREITVEGSSTAYVTPDTAQIRLGVYTEGETTEAVVEENTEKVNTIMDILSEMEIPEKDIKTTEYYLNPKWEWTEDRGSFQDGYILDQTIQVKLTDFEKIGDIISATTEAGANTVGGVQFTVENPETAKAEARKEAIAIAKQKANDIAEASGLELEEIVNYYEYSDGGYYPQPYGMGADTIAEESMKSIPEIEPGQQEVKLTVSLTYKID